MATTPRGTHFKGPVLANERLAAGALADLPIDVVSKLRDAYFLMDFDSETAGATDIASSWFWRKANIGSGTGWTWAQAAARGGAVVSVANASEGANVVANYPNQRKFAIRADTAADKKDLVCLWNLTTPGVFTGAGAPHWALVLCSKNGDPGNATPINSSGALDVSVQSVGFHMTAGTDTVPQMYACGAAGTEVVATDLNGGAASISANTRCWLGFRVQNRTLVTFYHGLTFDTIEEVGFVKLASTNLLDTTGYSPGFGFCGTASGGVSMSFHKLFIYTLNDAD